MTDRIITAEQALQDLREVVAEFGPATERTCQYAEYEQQFGEEGELLSERPIAPHCIVGVVLTREGVKLSELVRHEEQSVDAMTEPLETEDGGYLRLSTEAIDILGYAQRVQDDHQDWGNALRTAEYQAAEHERLFTEEF